MAKPDGLRPALVRFLAGEESAPSSPFRIQGAHAHLPGSDPAALARAAAVHDALGEASGFLGPFEMEHYLENWLARNGASESLDATVSRLVEKLRGPVPLIGFSIPVLRDQAPWIAGDLGGVWNLAVSLRDPAENDGAGGAMLTGNIPARTRLGGRIRAERFGLAWLGGAYAVGLLDLHFDDSQRLAGTSLHVEGVAADLTGEYLDVIDRSLLSPSGDLSDLERAAAGRGDMARAYDRRLRILSACMASDSRRAEQLRAACRLAARAASTIDFGLAVSFAFSVVEGLLLDGEGKDGVLARMTEAVAHLIGRSPEHREALRKQVKELYGIRSDFVHTGHVHEGGTSRREVLALMAAVLCRQMELVV